MGEYLQDGEYRRFQLHEEPDGMVWGRSPALNLDLCWDNGRLRYYDPVAGNYLLNWQEERNAREAAQMASETERAARQSAEERVAELEAELRRLQGETQ